MSRGRTWMSVVVRATSWLCWRRPRPCPEVSGKAREAHALSIHPRSQTDPDLTPAARLVSPEDQQRIGGCWTRPSARSVSGTR
jgi:hypothetical protein